MDLPRAEATNLFAATRIASHRLEIPNKMVHSRCNESNSSGTQYNRNHYTVEIHHA